MGMGLRWASRFSRNYDGDLFWIYSHGTFNAQLIETLKSKEKTAAFIYLFFIISTCMYKNIVKNNILDKIFMRHTNFSSVYQIFLFLEKSHESVYIYTQNNFIDRD